MCPKDFIILSNTPHPAAATLVGKLGDISAPCCQSHTLVLHQKHFLHHPLISISMPTALATTKHSCLANGSYLLLTLWTSSLTRY